MRVLHVAPSFYPALVYGGPTQSTYNLCRAVAAHGCEVRVLTTDANGLRTLEVDKDRDVDLAPGLTARYCRRQRPDSISAELLARLPDYARWADVVHVMAVYSFPTIPALAVSRLARRPVVWSPRGMLQRWEASRNRALKDAWDRVCAHVAPRDMTLLFTSKEEADESLARFPGFPSETIPNGVDLPASVTRTEGDGRLRLAFLGRLHPIKGLENLLDGFAEVTIPATLTIAGGGDPEYARQLRERAASLGVEGRVRFLGSVEGAQKTAVFAEADALLVPSFRESFSIVVIEALGHEVPVIAGRGTPWKRLEDEGCGLWVDNDPASLAAAIERIAKAPRREMGRRGRAWVEREFTWDLVAERTVALYRRLASASRQG